jgi:hypothetical protein
MVSMPAANSGPFEGYFNYKRLNRLSICLFICIGTGHLMHVNKESLLNQGL